MGRSILRARETWALKTVCWVSFGEIVQTYLADGARALCGDPGADDRRRVGRAALESGRMVRMDTNGHPDLRPEAPDLDRRTGLFRVPRPQDAHRSLHTGCPRTLDNVRQVRGKCFVREMAMAVDHRFSAS